MSTKYQVPLSQPAKTDITAVSHLLGQAIASQMIGENRNGSALSAVLHGFAVFGVGCVAGCAINSLLNEWLKR